MPRAKPGKTPGTTLLALAAVSVGLFVSCSDGNRIAVNVQLGTRSISKLPFVIAADQNLYQKYGLDVRLRLPESDFAGGIETEPRSLAGRGWRRIKIMLGVEDVWYDEVYVDGLTPNIVKQIDRARHPGYVAVASNDCDLRAHIISTPAIASLQDLKGKRIGISARRDTTTGYGALELARRMGWHPVDDISIKYGGRDIEALEAGLVDAIIASEIRYAVAVKEDLKILIDTKEWDVALGGNSILVEREWLAETENQEIVRRLIRALGEGLAIFHTDRELALDILQEWYGVEDREIAELAYERGQWMPRKPYPCYAGIENTLSMYDSNEMRKFAPADFYDDRFVREIDEDGFFDKLYSDR